MNWNCHTLFDVNTTSNIPIRFFVHNQTGEIIASLDLPISLVAGEEFQKAMGGSLAKKFFLRTKREESSAAKPEILLTLTFTPGAAPSLRQNPSQVFDLISNYGLKTSQSSFVVATTNELSTITRAEREKAQAAAKAWTPAKQGPLDGSKGPSKGPPDTASPPGEKAPKKFLVALDHDQDIKQFVLYDEHDPFASGTFGCVFIGTLVEKRSVVAVKVITLKSEVDTQKLAKEVFIQFMFDPALCANLLPLQFAFQTPSHFTLVMPLCKGGSLQDKLDKYQFVRERTALSYAKQCLLGIGYLHSLKVVHRDLKPLNIMFDAEEVLQIIDFGESEFLSGGAVSGEVGTPWYAAPEIFSEPSYTESVDLYAIGVTIFELLYGDVPWFWYDKVHDISNPLLDCGSYPDSYRTYPLLNPIDWNNLVPPQTISPGTTALLRGLINMNPDTRFTAERALKERIFQDI